MRGVSVAPVIERLHAQHMPEPNSGCWIWTGTLKDNGYGSMAVKVGGRWIGSYAHRVSYETFVGPIPAGRDLDHKCRVRCCINPAHLEAVNRSENLRRSPLMGRQAAKTTCPQGHPYSGTNSRGQRTCKICIAAATRAYRERR